MLGPSHWLHEIFIPKRVRHHFSQIYPFLSTGVPINLSQVQLSFLAMRQFDWPIAKKVETMEAPKIEDFMERWSAYPFGPPI
jgi:hypothetical protein